MRLKMFPWLGQEFLSLSWEGNGQGTVEDETCELFAAFSDRLGQFGLGLDHTVRTRMWVRDFATWQAGVVERGRILSGKARSVSSSHVRPDRLGPTARVGIDLLAMFPPAGGEAKTLKEYEPQTVVLRHLTWGGILFLSGVTDPTHATLEEQLPVIIGRLSDSLKNGNASWDKVVRASFFLHREETVPNLRRLFGKSVSVAIPKLDYAFVDTRQGKRVEIELTAKLS
jgi:enamine deaminase RidA (YjgF/YER057c/UK114 family)